MLHWTELGGWIAGLACAGYGLHRLALWLEARDWLIYTRQRRGGRVSMALHLAAAIDPTLRHVIEAQKREDIEEAESGDDFDPLSRYERD